MLSHNSPHPGLELHTEAPVRMRNGVHCSLFCPNTDHRPSLLQILGEHESSVKKMLDEFGVYLKPSIFGKDVKPFLKDACSQIFGSATGLVDMMVAHVPSSKAGNATKVSGLSLPFSCCLLPSLFSFVDWLFFSYH